MTAGCRLLPTDPTPFLKNKAETLRDHVIIAATHHHLLETPGDQVPLAMKNDALAFFAERAQWIADVSPTTLIALARLRRDYPADWLDRAVREHCRPWARTMRPTHLDYCIIPQRVMAPPWANRIIHGDCFDLFDTIPDGSLDLMATSPPYALQRDGGVSEADYPAWMVELMRRVRPKLKSNGSVIIVIRPHLRHGAESPYVRRTMTAITEDGWVPNGTLAWSKPDAPALGRVDRLRSAWEPMYWFSQSPNPYCKPKAIGHYSERLGLRTNKGAGKHIHHQTPGELTTGIARSPDVLTVPLASNDRSKHNTHTAQYPVPLAERLIRVFCPPGGGVLDPFIGSGSTAVAALRSGQWFVGFEKEKHYVDYAIGRYRREQRQRKAEAR